MQTYSIWIDGKDYEILEEDSKAALIEALKRHPAGGIEHIDIIEKAVPRLVIAFGNEILPYTEEQRKRISEILGKDLEAKIGSERHKSSFLDKALNEGDGTYKP